MTQQCVVGHDFEDKELGRVCYDPATKRVLYACEKHKDCLLKKYAIDP